MRVATTPLGPVRQTRDAMGMAEVYLRPRKTGAKGRAMYGVIRDSMGDAVWQCDHDHGTVETVLKCIRKADLSGCF